MTMPLANDQFEITAPDGGLIDIPQTVSAATDPYLALTSPAEIARYYRENGYVVVRNLIPTDTCDAARQAFISEVRPYKGYIYRQATANPEKNEFTEHGFVLNSVLNIQDLRASSFPRFRQVGLDVITHSRLHAVMAAVLGEQGKVVQSMYFEGNPVTWAHQDTYYLDSIEVGRMVGAWLAMEDIAPGAGRFYVYPGSHLIDMKKNGGDFDIAFNHSRYKQLVLDVIRSHTLECRAPALRKGDVLFWSSKTIHGSLPTTHSEFSRASFTVHAIPRSTGFLQYQSREKPLSLREIQGVPVHCPKDQNKLANRSILLVETTFPKLFQAVKKVAVKLATH
jgi:phytanoyl-CoA hydroxylase